MKKFSYCHANDSIAYFYSQCKCWSFKLYTISYDITLPGFFGGFFLGL